jgi:hypothetical protein
MADPFFKERTAGDRVTRLWQQAGEAGFQEKIPPDAAEMARTWI